MTEETSRMLLVAIATIILSIGANIFVGIVLSSIKGIVSEFRADMKELTKSTVKKEELAEVKDDIASLYVHTTERAVICAGNHGRK